MRKSSKRNNSILRKMKKKEMLKGKGMKMYKKRKNMMRKKLRERDRKRERLEK